MPMLVEKIIHIRDLGSHYNRLEFEFSEPKNIEYTPGVFKSIVPEDSILKYDVELDVNVSLFNQAGNTKIIETIGEHGLLYLELQSGQFLNEIFVEPDNVFSDIIYGKKSLIYSFYNSSGNETISLSLSSAKDTHNAYSKIKAHSTDLEWRQYFIKQAMIKPGINKIQISDPVIRELMTVDQVADYLQLKKKTIQNWTSNDKIPYCHIGGTVRYRKLEIDRVLDSKKR